MGLPQLLLIALFAMGLGYRLAEDGKVVTRKVSFWWSFIFVAIELGLLKWGGFFSGMGC